jgi:hypothetical protein
MSVAGVNGKSPEKTFNAIGGVNRNRSMSDTKTIAKFQELQPYLVKDSTIDSWIVRQCVIYTDPDDGSRKLIHKESHRGDLSIGRNDAKWDKMVRSTFPKDSGYELRLETIVLDIPNDDFRWGYCVTITRKAKESAVKK